MASPEDKWQPAATIAAALIARLPPSQVVSAEDAAEIYFDVLDALHQGRKGDDGPMAMML